MPSVFHSIARLLPEASARTHNLRNLERDVLQSLISDLSFSGQGDFLCRRVSEIAPDILPSIMYIDKQQRLRAWAVSLIPQEYVQAIEGLTVGEGVGSCGTAAARGVPVVCADIENDPLWNNYAALALAHGLKACWSFPIMRRDGTVGGSFAFYAKTKARPSPLHTRIISACTHLCMLAIEAEENRVRLERLTKFDRLTGLPNKDQLLLGVDKLLARREGTQSALFVLGLDRFRAINEGLGHAIGDQVILEIASRLQADLGQGELISRTEGDQFAIITPDCDAHAALRRANRLQAAVGRPLETNGHQLKLTACIGIVLGSDRDGHGGDLLNHAKQAMYEAKAQGIGTCRFFDAEMNKQAQRRVLLGAALRQALTNNELCLHYQPQVRACDGRLYGVEALARWNHPEWGAVSPEDFVGLAEDIGEIGALGRWALREACSQMVAWREQGLEIPVVSVNLSPTNFDEPGLVDYIAACLDERALSGNCLTIEITETAVMSLTPDRMRVVEGLRELGIGLSVDDFGTGYSSLSNLDNLPATEVKIDRSFVSRIVAEPRMRSLVMAVIGIGESLALTVVAEGVEYLAEHDLFRQHPHVVVQGYLFARPMAAPDLHQWLHDNAVHGVVSKASATDKLKVE